MRRIIEIDIIETPPAQVHDDKAVAISAKIVSFLTETIKRHNKTIPTHRVTLSQVKSVFKSGALAEIDLAVKHTKIQLGIARVNNYLEIVAGKPVEQVYKRKNKDLIADSFDYFECVDFSDSELVFAAEQALAFNIGPNEDFDSVESLYLDLECEKNTWFEI